MFFCDGTQRQHIATPRVGIQHIQPPGLFRDLRINGIEILKA